MGGAVARFMLEGRCLVAIIGTTPMTPVFAGSVRLTDDALYVGREVIGYGSEVRLPIVSGGAKVKPGPNKQCPTEALIVRSVADN